MRKINTLILFASIFLVIHSQAQTVYNNGFENLNADSSLSNWGNVYIFSVWIDSLGVSHSDSLVYDGPFYGPSSDAHSGNRALELRNAWNFTTNTGIAGAAAVDEDSVFSSWGTLNLVPTNATTFSPFAPINFGFYHKFSPVNGDSAYAQIALWDSSGYQFAEGTLLITAATNTYDLIYAPINYFNPGFAAFYSLKISTFYTLDPGVRQPGFGTRLLVDNIGFNYANTTDINPAKTQNAFSVYPNPAKDEIHFDSKLNTASPYRLCNIFGQTVMEGTIYPETNSISILNINSGVYFLEMKMEEKNICERIVVQR
jgi:hypothetical protein